MPSNELTFLGALLDNLAPKESDVLPAPLAALANVVQLPQTAITSLVGDLTDTGNDPNEGFLSRFARAQQPSEIVGATGLAGVAVDLVLDPMNLVGVGAFTKGKKIAQLANEGQDALAGITKAASGVADEAAQLTVDAKRYFVGEQELQNIGSFSKETPTFNKEAKNAINDLVSQAYEQQGFVFRDSNEIPIYQQLKKAFDDGILDPTQLKERLNATGVSDTDFLMEIGVSVGMAPAQAARQLNYLSQISKRNKKALDAWASSNPELADALSVVNGKDLTWWEKFKAGAKRIDNTRRGLLVTQVATSMRNAISQGGRVGLDIMQSSLDNVLQKALGVENAVNPMDSMEIGLEFFRQMKNPLQVLKAGLDPKKGNRLADEVLREFPKEWNALFGQFASDLQAGTFSKGAETAVNALNTLNRAQEFAFRRAIFQGKLQQALRKEGKDLLKVIESNAVGSINEKHIKSAVEAALEFTFQAAPKAGSLGQTFVQLVNKLPGGTLLMPFPRFFVNSIKFFTDFSPTGLLKLYSKNEWAKAFSGDTSSISRALLGAGMLGVASQIRDSEFAGEKWYELKVGDDLIDMRPFNPFSAYLFVADMAKRAQESRLNTLNFKDVAQGILGANLRAGTGLYVVDEFLNGLTGVGDPDKAARKLQEFTGEAIGGFFTPFQTIKDVVAEFDKSQRIVRNRREAPLTGAALSRIPYADSAFAPLESRTREGNIERQQPLLRQLTGITVQQPKNPAEAELDRLGFSFQEIQPSTGNNTADQLISKYMGKMVENVIGKFVQQPGYQRLSNAQQGEMVRQMLNRVRAIARRQAIAENPQLFLDIRQQRQPRRKRRANKEGA